jgi:hypothetical protein
LNKKAVAHEETVVEHTPDFDICIDKQNDGYASGEGVLNVESRVHGLNSHDEYFKMGFWRLRYSDWHGIILLIFQDLFPYILRDGTFYIDGTNGQSIVNGIIPIAITKFKTTHGKGDDWVLYPACKFTFYSLMSQLIAI